MPAKAITLKSNNHRIYQCFENKKKQLLSELIEQNKNLDILVATSKNAKGLKEIHPDVKILSDEELAELPELKCEYLINYDLAQTPQDYLSRVARASQQSVAIVDIAEQKFLYPIETTLGRVIKQEALPGYGYVTKKDIINAKKKEELREMRKKEAEKKEEKGGRDFKPKKSDKEKREFRAKKEDGEKREYKPRNAEGEKREFRPKTNDSEKREYKPKSFDDKKRDFKPKREDGEKREYKPKSADDKKHEFKPKSADGEKREYKPRAIEGEKRDFKPKTNDGEKREYKPRNAEGDKKNDAWAKKKKASSKFLGYDETGKAKFTGKSGERNHRYDGSKKEVFDAPKKPPRAINIKARKPEEK
ncbi:MAG: DEAD/DEAH box helicase [Sulfurimonas sp.]|jgi:superfamily II DNA/RNA helicase|nr:DEAD/DEAH box helicase [Sulfurimonas sp.]MBU1217057.1 DEAD/DEAH box helicase [bacterium]MBU1435384.1 DEAD/DEAH box helicase [bacterium]MBU1502305.1 DEAD/DEAH box helicase [bacterium]MBU3940245.1 DEAD/DEAH box helicase [bacterium]